MRAAWLWLAAAAFPAPLLEEVLTVPPAGWRPFPLTLRQQPALIDCRFTVRQGPPVRLWLLERRDLARFQTGGSLNPVAVTASGRSGELRRHLGLGEFVLILDNRLNRREAARVHLRIGLDFAAVNVRQVSPERRAVVIAASLLFLFAVSFWFARRLGPRLWARLRR